MLAAETRVAPASDSIALLAKSPVDWKQIIQPLEPFLQAVSKRMGEQISAFEPDLASYASYALNAQGKQLRPALVGLSAGATGKIQDSHVTVAVIIEMVHLATLVHDDVMDEATIRRGRPTLAANWGNEISVLLGDCLFAHSLKLAAGFPTTEVCRAVASSTNTVCMGEILQTQRRGNLQFTRTDYLKVLAMKTGELFALACDLGAFLNGAPAREREALRGYGMALGTAYQIYDDCLDVFGSEGAAGKSLGTDLAKGKVTLPLLVLLERKDAGISAKVESLIGDYQPQNFEKVVALLRRHGALHESLRVIESYLKVAREYAGELRKGDARAGLVNLCEVLAAQTESLGGAA
ncbi:MAG TPA: polyprenyl synthetase family protein [Candidatus Limnocylindria bacterium]|nr:polyprenyl synthetase family protein [Candidatus Limnocylindria bacterium]